MIQYETAEDDLLISFEQEDTEDLIYKKKRILSSDILTLEQRRQTRLTMLKAMPDMASPQAGRVNAADRASKTKSMMAKKSKRLDDDYTRKAIFLMIRILFTPIENTQMPVNNKYLSIATVHESLAIAQTLYTKECIVMQHLIEQQRKIAKEIIFKLSLSNFNSVFSLIEGSIGDMYVNNYLYI